MHVPRCTCWLVGCHRRGITLPEVKDPRAAQYRERFFNFYDEGIMDGAWFKVGVQSGGSSMSGPLSSISYDHGYYAAEPPCAETQSAGVNQ
jgi:hypothetical protein